ncbi:D-alanine---D-serine ligase [Salirhabdus euzebyi]|uniref:D-alanine--D-alanine ligase n=1 Tax=Salirhabdus euzebyi TaxID=394506 RepID=A0A841Q121_9BACI|nr:D-alanine--D-serine ligase VanG [Salirhabdus euzebyi]MBB6451673.1 D-alanine---D-serine ligase [Salirhabdus euzebyi]
MEKIKVAILFGGYSSEYEVSLQSAHAIITNLDKKKYDPIMIGITEDGKWLRYDGEVNQIRSNTWFEDYENCCSVVISPDRYANKLMEFKEDGTIHTEIIDVIFPILHGKYGEDGTVQGMANLAGIPIVGCHTLSSALCMDKDKAHQLVSLAGIRIPSSVVFSRKYLSSEVVERTNHLTYPLFVKPVKAGSSHGITKVYQKEELQGAVDEAFLYDDQVIVEENIEGFEVGCAILGNETLTVGEIDEIELTTEFFDYKEKYTLETSKIHVPARINQELTRKVKETAITIYRALGCSGLARVDMFLTPENEIVFNEVNTFPGFTEHSRFPTMMKGIGLEFGALVDKLIQLGLEK